jgi:DNA uptake protein ComE-like DNA-binding protein
MSRFKSLTMLAVALCLMASLAYAQGGSSTPAASTPAPATATAPKAEKAEKAAPAKHASMKKAAMAKCDLNSASKEELMTLAGVGDATADKIVAARPFKNKSELVSKGIVTKKEYAKISAHVIAKQAAAAAK